MRRLAGAREVAVNTLTIPHPYPQGAAEEWIAGQPDRFRSREAVVFAVCLRESDELVGAMGLDLAPEHEKAELGYWIGVPYWGRGYATEAARAVLAYGFGTLGLERVVARHYARNPASGRVLRKLGMRKEGVLRRDIRKWGEFVDVVVYGILREEHGR